MSLHDSEGANKIIEKYEGKTVLVAAPEAALDVDTLEDYEKLKGLTFPA
jgi:CTP:molybdopterin cytidylyltransferase MocA